MHESVLQYSLDGNVEIHNIHFTDITSENGSLCSLPNLDIDGANFYAKLKVKQSFPDTVLWRITNHQMMHYTPNEEL